MNRLPSLVRRGGKSRSRSSAKPPRVHTIAKAECLYFAPLHYEPNYSYPLLVWLHSPDSNENQLKQIMPLVSLRNYVGASPRGTALSSQDGGSQIQFCWQHDEVHISLALERLAECIDGATKRFNIARRRVFVAGLESGGTMALRLAMKCPSQFAGALSIGGAFPTERAPLAALNEVRRLPLFFATTSQSVQYPQTEVCQHLRLFHSAGMSITIRQYPGEDGLTDLMLADMDRWIMERITKSQAADESQCEHHSAN